MLFTDWLRSVRESHARSQVRHARRRLLHRGIELAQPYQRIEPLERRVLLAAPVFDNDTYEFSITRSATGSFGSVSASDGDGDVLTYAGGGSGFVVSADGNVEVAEGATLTLGEHSFEATVDDGNNGSDSATVTVNVTNGAPEFDSDDDPDVYAITVDAAATGSVLTLLATDPDGDAITFSGGNDFFTVLNGDVIVSGTLTPGNQSFEVTATDSSGATDSADINVTVFRSIPQFKFIESIDVPIVDPEGDAGTQTISLPVRISGWAVGSGPTSANASVYFETVAETAAAGSDFVAASGTMTIPAGQYMSDPAIITILSDNVIEGNETFLVRLSNPFNAEISHGEIRVTIVDDDWAPQFAVEEIEIIYQEYVPAGHVQGIAPGQELGTISASDADGDTLTYGGVSAPFAINSTTGAITALQGFYSGEHEFEYTVTADDGFGGTDSAHLTISISITEYNTVPEFSAATYTISLPEDTAVGSIVASMYDWASDPDNHLLTYSGIQSPFALDPYSQNISLESPLDYETQNEYEFDITVSDGYGGYGDAVLLIEVTDVLEGGPGGNEPPEFDDADDPDTYEFTTNSAATGTIGSVSATDPDDDPLMYAGSGSGFTVAADGSLQVDSGVTLTAGTYSFGATVSDGNGGSDSATITVTVSNGPPNQPPEFDDEDDPDTYSFTIAVTATGDIGSISATDPDSDPLDYDGSGSGFLVDSDGTVSIASGTTLTAGTYSFTAAVSDGQGGSDSASIEITVTAGPNEPPEFDDSDEPDEYHFSILESAASGAVVGTVTATDPNDDELVFDGAASPFAIDPDSGTITLTGEVDYETESSYVLNISVSDGTLSDSATVYIDILNVLEPPIVSNAEFSIPELPVSGGYEQVGTIAASTVEPTGAPLTFQIAPSDPLSIGESSGMLWVDSTQIDFEEVSEYVATVTVTDANGLQSTATVTVSILDVNEPPAFTATEYEMWITENVPLGSVAYSLAATDPDLNDVLTFAENASNSTFDVSPNGEIVVVAAIDYESLQPQNLSVRVTDSDGLTDTVDVIIHILDAPEAPVAHDVYVTANEDVLYVFSVNDFPFTDQDAGDNLTTVAIGSLPAQGTLSLNGAPVPLGTPISRQAINDGALAFVSAPNGNGDDYATFEFYVADSTDLWSNTGVMHVNVQAVNDSPVIQNPIDYSVEAGHLLEFTVSATDPEAPPQTLTYSLNAAASLGMSIHPQTGLFTWTPSVAHVGATALATVTVTDNGTPSASNSRTFRITVRDHNRPPRVTSEPVVDATIGQVYAYTVAAADSDGDILQYSLVQSPSGMTINSATGLITWNPAVALVETTSDVTVRVSDGRGGIAEQSFELAIHPDPTNHAPLIISDPQRHHTVALPNTSASRFVTPTAINLELAPGETAQRELTVEVNPAVPDGLPVEPPNRFTVLNETNAQRLLDALLMGGNSGIAVSDVFFSGHSELAQGVESITDVTVANGGSLQMPVFADFAPLAFHLDSESVRKGIDISYEELVGGSEPGPRGSEPSSDEITGPSALLQWTPGPDDYDQHHIVSLTSNTFGYESFIVEHFVITVGNPTEPKPELPEQSRLASSGIYVNDTGAFGLSRYGIVLSTGNAEQFGEAFTHIDGATYAAYGVPATPEQEALLQPLSRRPILTPGENGEWLITGWNTYQHADVTELTITFDVLPGFDTIYFDLVFGTEEYPEWVDSEFQDALGLYVNGQNIAVQPGAVLQPNGSWTVDDYPLSVRHTEFRPHRTIRERYEDDPDYANLTLYPHLHDQDVDFEEQVEFSPLDGLLAPNGQMVLHLSAPVDPGSTDNELTFIIGDTSDAYIDTTVYIANLGAAPAWDMPIDVIPSVAGVGFTNLSGTQLADAGDTLAFTGEFTGLDTATAFDLNFVNTDTGSILGTIPVTVNNDYFYLLQAIDPDGDELSYSLVGPEGASIDPATGRIQWDPTAPGDYEFTVSVADDRGGVATQLFVVSVTDGAGANASPVIDSQAPVNAQVSRPYEYRVLAHDTDGHPLQYYLADAPEGMHIDRDTGRIEWVPDRDQRDLSFPVIVRVYDRHGGVTNQSFTIQVLSDDVDDNRLPLITSRPASAAVADVVYEYRIIATDADGDALNYELVSGPAGAYVDSDSRTLVWLPTRNDEGLNELAVRVHDGHGGVVRQRFVVDVSLPNYAPEFGTEPVTSGFAGTVYAYWAQALDPNGDAFTYSLDAASVARGLTIDDETGLILWNRPVAGTYQVTVTATDDRGASSDQSYELRIRSNSPPQFASDTLPKGAPGLLYNYDLGVVDPDGDVFVISLQDDPETVEDESLAGLGISIVDNRYLRWDDPVLGQYVVGLTASDGWAALSLLVLLEITDEPDNHGPDIESAPMGPGIVGTQWVYTIEATDEDEGDNLSIELAAGPSNPAATASGPATFNASTGKWTRTFTWTPSAQHAGEDMHFEFSVSDDHGASLTQKFDLPVIGNAALSDAPVIESTPNTQATAGQLWNYDVIADDPNGNSNDLTYSLTRSPAGMTLTGTAIHWTPNRTGLFPVELRVTDSENLVATQSWHIRVTRDPANASPSITSVPDHAAVLNVEWTYALTATDPDGDAVWFELASGPEGMTLGTDNVIRWIPRTEDQESLTVYVHDGRGGSDGQRITLPINVNHAPRITSTPDTITLLGSQYRYTVEAADTDLDDISLSLDGESVRRGMTLRNGVLTWTPAAKGKYEIIVTATDTYGDQDVQRFQLTVRDNLAPEFTSSPITDAYVGEEWIYPLNGRDVDGDRFRFSLVNGHFPDGMVLEDGYRLAWTPAEADAGSSVSVTVAATDELGAQSLHDFEIQVHSETPVTNRVPVVRSRPTGPAWIGEEWTYDIEASDPEGTPLTFSLISAPNANNGMTIDPISGLIEWTPAFEGNYWVQVWITDLDGAGVSHAFQLPVTHQNSPPKIFGVPYDPVFVGTPWRYQILADDPDGDYLTYSLDAPDGFSIDEHNVITWTPTNGDVGHHDDLFSITVTDGNGGEWTEFVTLDVQTAATASVDGDSPVVTSVPAGPAIVGQTWECPIFAIDPNGEDSELRFYVASQNTVPELSIHPVTGLATFTPTQSHVGQSYTFAVLVEDGQGHQTVFTLPLEVIELNQSPVITPTPLGPLAVGVPWTYQVSATDANGDSLHYYLDQASLDAGMSIDSSGLITWTPTSNDLPGRSFLLTVYDGDPESAEGVLRVARHAFTAIIAPEAPQAGDVSITSQPRTTALLNRDYTYQVQLNNPNNLTLTYEVTGPTAEFSGSDLAINAQTGLVTWKPTQIGNFGVILRVRSGQNIVATKEFTISSIASFRLEEPPEFITTRLGGPALRDVPYQFTVRAADANGDPLLFSIDQAALDFGMDIEAQSGQITWTPHAAGTFPVDVTVSDGLFSTTRTYSLVVLRNAPPRITSDPPTTALIGTETSPIVYTYEVEATDPNSDDVLTYALAQSPAGMNINASTGVITWTPQSADRGRHSVTITVSDGQATVQQSYELQAYFENLNEPPEFQNTPRSSISVNREFVHIIQASDADGDAFEFQLVSGPRELQVSSVGVLRWRPTSADLTEPGAAGHEVRVRVTDRRGQSTEATWHIRVTSNLENTAPQIIAQPQPKHSATLGYTYHYQPVATDGDDDSLAWRLLTAPDGMTVNPQSGRLTWTPTMANGLGSHAVTLLVEDAFGGSARQSWTIVLRGANLPPLVTSDPETLAALDEPYSYSVQAYDPDEGDIWFSLVASPNGDAPPAGMTIDPVTGTIVWVPSSLDPVNVTVRVTDDRNAWVDQTWTIVVYDPAINEPPRFDSTPGTWVVVGTNYSYAAHAVDPESTTLTYDLELPPALDSAPITFNAATGLLTWNSVSQDYLGTHRIVVTASDGVLIRRQAYDLLVRTNANPLLADIADRTLVAGQRLAVDLSTSDPDEDAVSVSLEVTPINGTTSTAPLDIENGQIVWRSRTGTDDIGVWTVTVTASDGFGGSVTDDFTLTVVPDEVAPTMTIMETPDPVQIHRPVQVHVAASDNVGVEFLTLTLVNRLSAGATTALNQPIELSSAGKAFLTLHDLGTYTLQAVAVDAVGNTTTTTSTFEVLINTDFEAPLVSLTRPSIQQILTEPAAVIGTIDDAADELENWTLIARPLDGGPDIAVASGGSTEIVNGTLGLFDTTLIANGVYNLILTATDLAGNVGSTSVRVDVRGQYKLGNFTIGFTDLEINTPGIPIRVSRTYNSLHAGRNLDFGHGWSLDLSRPRVEISYPDTRQTALEGNFIPFRDGTRVVVTLPDGTSEGFTFEPYPIVNNNWNFGLGVTAYRPYFTPDPGNLTFLEVSTVTLVKANGSDEYTVMSEDFSESFGNVAYNPTRLETLSDFILYTKAGPKYGIDSTGADRAYIEDRNGNRVTFTSTMIEHSNGMRVLLERDNQNRITALIDPAGNRVEYVYSTAGDLVAVRDRVQSGSSDLDPEEFRDDVLAGLLPSEAEPFTRYGYDMAHAHFLATVVDPLGREAIAAEYTTAGRLGRTTDASGQSTDMSYSLGRREQRVRSTDSEGNPFETVLVADAHGNVLSESGPGGTILRTYDDHGRVLTETRVIGEVDSPRNGEHDDQTTMRTYDRYGMPRTETNSRRQTQASDYDRFGNVIGIVDEFGNRTTNTFDDRGNLLTTTSGGRTTSFSHDDMGNVTQVRDDQGHVLVSNTYDNYGRLSRTVNVQGQETFFVYDALGRQIETRTVRTDENGQSVTIFNLTTYNANDQVTGTSQIAFDGVVTNSSTPGGRVLAESTTQYFSNGQIRRTVDRNGLATEYRYDARGLQIEVRTQAADSAGNIVWMVQRTVHDHQGRAIYSTDSYREGTADPVYATRAFFDAAGRATRTERRRGVAINISGPPPYLQATVTNTGSLVSASETQYDSVGRAAVTIDQFGRETRSTYNDYGELVETRMQAVDENGNVVWLVSRSVYDDHGRVLVATDRYREGSSDPIYGTRTVYDVQGRVVETQRLRNLVVVLEGNVTRVSSLGTIVSRSRTTYNTRGQVVQTIAPDGQTTTFDYDDFGRRTATIGHAVPVGQVFNLPAPVANLPAGTKVAHRTETVYDTQGRVELERIGVLHIVAPDGTVTIDRSAARETGFTYDEFGNVVRTTFADGSFQVKDYDDQGRVIAESAQVAAGTSPAAVEATKKRMSYDLSGRLISVELPAVPDPLNNNALTHPTYHYGYSANGNMTSITDPLGRVTWFTFDAQGHQLTRTLPLGAATVGQVSNLPFPTTDAERALFTEYFSFDNQGRQTLHVSFEGVVTEFNYDLQTGRLQTKKFYDSLDTFNSGTITPLEVWTFSYDAFSREIRVEQAVRPTITSNDWTTRVVETQYDTQGRISRVTSPEGVIGYDYDSLGRRTATWTSRAGFQPVDPATPDERTTYGYDPLGRLSSVTVTHRNGEQLATPEVTLYRYDLLGNLARVDLPNGVIAIYAYDSMNRLEALTYYRAEDGDVVGSPDPTTNPTTDTDMSDNPKLADFDYTVAANGQRTGMIEQFWIDADAVADVINEYDWSYDGLNRLTDEIFTTNLDDVLDAQTAIGLPANADLPTSSRPMRDYHDHYTFDLIGNRLRKTTDLDVDGDVDRTVASAHDANDRLLTESHDDNGDTTVDRATLYGYGANNSATYQTAKDVYVGNPSALGPQLSALHLQYDLQGRLWIAISTTFDGTSNNTPTRIERTTYDYDHTGIRVSALHETDADANEEFETAVKTEYLVDANNFTGYQQVIRETHSNPATSDATKVIIYAFCLDEISQTTVEFTNNQPGQPTTLYFTHDGHGSVRALLNAVGAVATIAGIRQLFTFDAYGNAIGFAESTAGTNLLYSGEQFDQRVMMQYLRGRYYDSASARFEHLDPYAGRLRDPLSLHKYLYTHASPINNSDPTGEFSVFSFSGLLSVGLLGAGLGVVGNGLANWSHDRPFLENAGSAAFWGAGLGILGVLSPAVGAILAGVGLGSAIANFSSVWDDGTARQRWAATGLVLLSAFGAWGASKYGANTSGRGLFWFNPGGFNFSAAAAFRQALEVVMTTAKTLKQTPVYSMVTTAIALVQQPNGQVIKVAMGNGANGKIVPAHRAVLPADVLTPQFPTASVPARFLNSSGRPHAEGYIFAWAESLGYRVLGVGANRGICPECAVMITNEGAGHCSPLRDNIPELSPLDLFYDMFGFSRADAAGATASGSTGILPGIDYDDQAY